MQISISKQITFLILIVVHSSCNQNKSDRLDENKRNVTTIHNVDTILTEGNKPAQQPILNYNNWETFWSVFATAAKTKDTTTIIALTNFPFFQNTELVDKEEFSSLWVSQVYDLDISDSPVLSSELLLQLGENKKAILPRLDSVRATYENNKHYYFGKVSGYYKLIEIITPG